MKRIFILLIILMPFYPLLSQGLDEQFRKGNEAYEKNNYKIAIENYELILKSGFESGELLYNLGNAYFRTGQFALAILNYERAKKYLPNDSDLAHNLTIANLRIPDKFEKVPKLFIFEWWESLKNIFSLSNYQYFILILFVFFIFFITIFFWSKNYVFRQRTFFTGLVFTIIFVTFTIAFITKAVEEKNRLDAITIVLSTEVKSSPDENGTNLYIIRYGLKIEIIDELNEWIKVILPDGKKGWLKRSSIEII